MKAKILVYALPALILAAIHLAEAQQPGKSTDRLSRFSRYPEPAPCRRISTGVTELGYVEGKNIVVDVSRAEGN